MTEITSKSPFVPHDIARPIGGGGKGPLAGFTVAVKDMFDISGEKTGGGNPAWLADARPASLSAAAVERLIEAGATIVGKTICDEFFFSLAGVNEHYGTPPNLRAPGRLPGGSSSGSAAAVAAGVCDIAIGSDTGGSVRVPAAFCGTYGIRPTHGRVDMRGAMGMAPSFDTIGWFAAGAGLLRKVGSVLLGEGAVPAAIETVELGRDCFDDADPEVNAALGAFLTRAASILPRYSTTVVAPQGYDCWREIFRVIQAREIWAIYGAWIEARQPRLGAGIRERLAYAKSVGESEASAARSMMDELRASLRHRLRPGTILAIPTAPCIAPLITVDANEMERFRSRTMALTCIAGLGGLPQITIPVGTVAGAPVGLSFVGWAGSDEVLLDLAAALARFCAVCG